MKQQLWDHLSQPYQDTRTLSPERLRWKALQVDVPAAHKLEALVFADLDEVNFGIRWWRELEAPKRILLADYLLAALRSVSINLCEAALHHHELAEWVDREAHWKSYGHVSGETRLGQPIPVSVAGDLPPAMVDMHCAGFFRAIASSLDCFAATATIVLGLRIEPYHARYSYLAKEIAKHGKAVPIGPPDVRAHWLKQIAKMEQEAADGEWGEWLSQARHQYVHKPRRLLYCMPMSKSTVYLSKFEGIKTLRIGHFMPSQPQLTEVQDRREAQYVPVLTEELNHTTRLGLKAVVDFMRSSMALLLEVWEQRRTGQLVIEQPASQWQDIAGPARIAFRGFAPGTVPYKPDAFTSDADYIRRLKASAVLDDQRHLWDMWVNGPSPAWSSSS